MRLNAAAGEAAVHVERETMEVLVAAQTMAAQSGGVFDVTMGAMGGLWHFDEDLDPVIPSAEAIAQRRKHVGFGDLVLDVNAGTARLMRAGMSVNLGGIAKGYAVDVMRRVLNNAGLRNVLIQAGGDLLVSGRKRDDAWRVGIRDPRDPAPDAYFAVAPITDHAFSTAGDYERAFIRDGKRYHHILDPRTGYPADACRSVTVFAPSALIADALDDAIFILGPEHGLALLANYPGTGAVIVDKANKVWISDAVKNLVTVIAPPTP
jgi:thiamine biosynthesis lipoprotein